MFIGTHCISVYTAMRTGIISEKLEGALMATSFYRWYYFLFPQEGLKPVEITKNLAPNHIMSFGAANS